MEEKTAALLDGLADTLLTVRANAVDFKDPKLLSRLIYDESEMIVYTGLVSWLCGELRAVSGIEEVVSSISDSKDTPGFLLELSGFLREANCPHPCLTSGALDQRLESSYNKALLLCYLSSELQAARMIASRSPDSLLKKTQSMQLTSTSPSSTGESDLAAHMRKLIIALGMSKPPANLTPKQLFSKLIPQIQTAVNNSPSGYLSRPLLKASLTENQWNAVLQLNSQLSIEYRTRRNMLLKRLDVTIQSFLWSDIAKRRSDDIAKVYRPIRDKLSAESKVGICDILAAREDLLYLRKTTDDGIRAKTATKINKVMMGNVPDRGGRPHEQRPPPPEMPQFQQRRADPPRGRGGGGFGGRGDQRGGGGRGSYQQRGGGRDSQWSAGGGGGGYQKRSKRARYY